MAITNWLSCHITETIVDFLNALTNYLLGRDTRAVGRGRQEQYWAWGAGPLSGEESQLISSGIYSAQMWHLTRLQLVTAPRGRLKTRRVNYLLRMKRRSGRRWRCSSSFLSFHGEPNLHSLDDHSATTSNDNHTIFMLLPSTHSFHVLSIACYCYFVVIIIRYYHYYHNHRRRGSYHIHLQMSN